jgi:hypothetical protein
MSDPELLSSGIEFAAAPDAVRYARHWTARLLAQSEPGDLVDAAVLLVSELVTNASAPRGALLYPRCSREELKGGSWA